MAVLILASLLLFCSPYAESGELRKIGALGRIEPRGGVVSLAGPNGDPVVAVCAKEGDFVKRDSPLIIFRSNALLQQELALAEIALKEADEAGNIAVSLQELKLRQAEESRAESLARQELKLKSVKEEHELSSRRLQRFQKIGGESLSAQQMDDRQTEARVAQIKLNSAMGESKYALSGAGMNVELAGAELNRLKLNREINIRRATQQLELAKERLKHSVIRAPVDGTVLEIFQSEGEVGGPGPIVNMGDLEHMYVVADVYDRDLLQIKPGMKVEITSKSLPEPLAGQVETIGRVIALPARTAPVRIRLDDVRLASQLINVEVDVSIQLQ
ncbi:MAG: efflux RND transporter periplasmic adaptor subunit [Desulfobacteraceae bacterium]|nr:efflux RND transporter periplasmic adaptor subunit [Desulfobacteraceae bacterium]